MRTYDFGLWIRYMKWENGIITTDHIKVDELTFEQIKEMNSYRGLEVIYNGKKISSLRNAKFFWAESFPHMYASQGSKNAHMSSKVPGGSLARVKDMRVQLQELIVSLQKTEEVLGYVEANYADEKDK